MLKIFKIAALIFIAAAGVIVGMAMTKPDYFRIERTTVINAPAEKIYTQINILKNWKAWSPWEDMDPDMERTLTGPDGGVGAKYGWKGDKNIGEGSMAITESFPDSKVVLDLDFTKPFKAHNKVTFTLDPETTGTRVTYAMEGPQPFFGKVISVVMNCDKMVGGQFEKALANLKNTVEAKA